VLVMFMSLVSLVFIFSWSTDSNSKSAAIQLEINKLNQEAQKLQERASQVKNSLSGEQWQTLASAHALVDRKSFSWSRLFADLEAALPGTVRVSRITVRDVASRNGQTVAELDMAVFAKSSTTITEMIADMERSAIFKAYIQSQNLQKGRAEAGTEYELYVIYTPRAGVAIKPEVAAVEPGGGNK
jgi:Tfp pilus assembly protein PilN